MQSMVPQEPDSERILLMLLLFVLWREKADRQLLIALAYILLF